MSRLSPIIKREFTETVGKKSFVIMTIIGPLLLFFLFFVQFAILMKSGGGAVRMAIMDGSPDSVGTRVAAMLRVPQGPSLGERATYEIDVKATPEAQRAGAEEGLAARIEAKELDGYLAIPADVATGGTARYVGRNATNTRVMQEIRASVQRVVQSSRLQQVGIDEATLTQAMKQVPFAETKTGRKGTAGSPIAAKILAFIMAFAIYIVVILYGQATMSAVQEEKRDRIVELVVSSVRARDLLIGKVFGIGAAGLVQMSIWAAAAGMIIWKAGALASLFHASPAVVQALTQKTFMPDVPASMALIFLVFFAGGFFMFATMFAVIGSIVTNPQEAQQLVFPVMMPFIIGLYI
ncbi:MAG: ABC transporter permease, partial [Longimicrobiales bacterium]